LKEQAEMNKSKPLSGYCVVEIGNSIAAPFAGMILAELGAKVIKVEPPEGGDPARGWGPPFFDGASPHHAAMNRGKHSITVNLSDTTERSRLVGLIVERADAVICNLRPGSVDKLGLGAAHLRALKPELVYAEIGAFGGVGPLATAPGYDPLMQAYAGLMGLTAEDSSRPPIRVAVSIVDMGAGFWTVIGILATLLQRQTTGEGASVQTSLLEAALAWTTIQIANVTIEPRRLEPQGSGAAGIVPYQAFLTSNGWLVIAAGNDGLFRKLVDALEMEELKTDVRFTTNADRVVNRGALIALLETKIESMSIEELSARLDKYGVPNSRVQHVDELAEDEQVRALEMLQDGPPGALSTMGLPLRFDSLRPAYERKAPALGADNAEILGDDDLSNSSRIA
jgi:crotonobetainyl-CoA:carnitine CoA-transferase CaiB-like acyl-CoA transferase